MLLRLDNVCLAYGARALLDHVNLQLSAGERVAIVGRNGEGKSSLLRLLLRQAEPDSGTIWVRTGARVAHLAQDLSPQQHESVQQLVAGGLPQQYQAATEYLALSARGINDETQRRRLDELHRQLDAGEGWQLEQRVERTLSRLQLDPNARVNELSGGWRRRALLARALVCEPDVLLLDEPTNHLDIEAIEWLEQFLLEYAGALLFVSHDRLFIEHLATRIVELDRGTLSQTVGSFTAYERAREQRLHAEAQQQALFDKKLAQEEVWIRKGVEARRTRNEGRVRALYALRAERRARRERTGQLELEQQRTGESGALIFEAEQLTLHMGERTLVRDFSARIMRGDRIGLVGPNGAGKSTLIRALLGQIEPTAGQVRRGSRLEIAYYDQERAQLALDETVLQNVAGRNDQVLINGQARHASGYLRDFLFRPDQLHTPARALSGGERNRLLLARLFAHPANVLVMDEPTNDLDIDTLELLEEYVAEFPGTLLLVSHDRSFLDHVVTSVLVFEGEGRVREYVGGYSDWARMRSSALPARAENAARESSVPATPARSSAPRRLSYREQRELSALPEQLQQLEAQKSALESQLSDPALYRSGGVDVKSHMARLNELGQTIDSAYARWAELEALAAATAK